MTGGVSPLNSTVMGGKAACKILTLMVNSPVVFDENHENFAKNPRNLQKNRGFCKNSKKNAKKTKKTLTL